MKRLALALAVALALGCTSTEGDVLTRVGGDGGGDPGDDGGPQSCEVDSPCPAPSPGDLTVCGRVVDLETSARVADPNLTVYLFDLLDITSGPPGANPIATATADGCGWFVAEEIQGLLPGVVAVATDDAGFDRNDYERVVSLVPAATGQTVRTNAYAMRQTTNDAWTEAADIGFSFASRGAFVAIYIDITEAAVGPFQGAPVAGVALEGPGSPQPFYFGDAQPLSRGALDRDAAATGANGATVVLEAQLTSSYSGAGVDCDFDDASSVAVPNVVQVQEIVGSCR